MRAPGKFQAPLVIEHIIEHVAARLDMDPVAVREINFLKAPAPGLQGNLHLLATQIMYCACMVCQGDGAGGEGGCVYCIK